MTPYGVDSASKDFELLKQFSARTGVEVQADAPEAFDAATFLGDANAAKGGARAALKAAYDALRPNAPLVVCTVPLSGPPPPVSQADMDGLLAVDEDLRTTAAVLAAAGFERCCPDTRSSAKRTISGRVFDVPKSGWYRSG